MRRRSLPNGASKRLFTATAKRVHKKNASPNPMRGGIRL